MWYVNVANTGRKQMKRAVCHSFYSYALISLNICYFGRVKNARACFQRVENKREYFWSVQSAFKARWKPRRVYMYDDASCPLLYTCTTYLSDIFDASCTFWTHSKCHWIIFELLFRRRFKNVHDALSKYAIICRCYLDASCKFINDIYNPSARIIKNPLNSTVFWARHLNSVMRQLRIRIILFRKYTM